MDGDGERLTVMEADGSRPRVLGAKGDRHPTWSPEGTRIAFTRHFQDGNTLWMVNADGTGLRQLSGRIEPVE